jgi:hypothetical protein
MGRRQCEIIVAPNDPALKAAGDFVALVQQLRCGSAAAKAAAAKALFTLAVNIANHVLIVEAGAVAPLVELLRCGDAAGKVEAADALKMLAMYSNEHKVLIMEAGAVAPLVESATITGKRRRRGRCTCWRGAATASRG